MDFDSLLQAEVVALAVGGLAFGKFIIDFVKRTIQKNDNARDELISELRLQIKKLEKRIALCEERWLKHVEKHIEETKQ